MDFVELSGTFFARFADTRFNADRVRAHRWDGRGSARARLT